MTKEQLENYLSNLNLSYYNEEELEKENAELKNRDCWKSCELED